MCFYTMIFKTKLKFTPTLIFIVVTTYGVVELRFMRAVCVHETRD